MHALFYNYIASYMLLSSIALYFGEKRKIWNIIKKPKKKALPEDKTEEPSILPPEILKLNLSSKDKGT